MLDISIHALAKRATKLINYQIWINFYFNPRPREEGDSLSVRLLMISLLISIHALAKRATG